MEVQNIYASRRLKRPNQPWSSPPSIGKDAQQPTVKPGAQKSRSGEINGKGLEVGRSFVFVVLKSTFVESRRIGLLSPDTFAFDRRIIIIILFLRICSQKQVPEQVSSNKPECNEETK